MAKIVANVSKKMPVPGVEYSSQQFSGSLEVELPAGVTDEQIQARFHELYALLSQTVDGEIAAATGAARETGVKRRFPDPAGIRENGDAKRQPDDRRRGHRSDDRIQEFRRESGEDSRDRSPRNPGDGWSYCGSERRDDRRDSGHRSSDWQGRNAGVGGNSGNRGGAATQAQVKAVFGIAKANGIERHDLVARVSERFGVRRIEELNVRQASRLIEDLKAS